MQELKNCPFCGEMPEMTHGEIVQCEHCDIRIYPVDAWNHRVGKLPEGMENRTILFKECEKGHGRLTANNWIDKGCPHCVSDGLRQALAGLLADITEYQTVNNLGGENNHWQIMARKALSSEYPATKPD